MATCTISVQNGNLLNAGDNAITGSYNGDNNYNPKDGPGTQTVVAAKPSFSNLTQNAKITYGNTTVTLTGTLSAPGPVYPPPSTMDNPEIVTVTIDGGIPQQSTMIKDDTGDFTIVYNTTGIDAQHSPHTIKYEYAGDGGNFTAASPDTSTSLTVGLATPSFSGITQPAAIDYGTPSIMLTGVVSAPGPVYPPPSTMDNPEIVTVTIDNNAQPTPISDNVGGFKIGFVTTSQSFTIPAGMYPIIYSYPGDGKNFNPAPNNTATTLTVNKVPVTSFTVTGPSTATYGDPVKFTATVDGVTTPGAAAPTGNVVFTDTYNNNSSVLCTSALTGAQNNSTATCNVTGGVLMGSPPSHTITASYGGDNNYTKPDDVSLMPPLTISPATPTIDEPSASPMNPTYGVPVTFTTNVHGVMGARPPTGTVVFTDTTSNTKLCSAGLNLETDESTATCTAATKLLGGVHNIVAVYNGDTNYSMVGPSTQLSLTISPAPPNTSITASSVTSLNGQAVTFTAMVLAVNGGVDPTGTVSFTVTPMGQGSVAIPGCSQVVLASSQATCTTSTLLPGSNTVAASYSGDNNYSGNSFTLTQTVEYFQLGGLPTAVAIIQGSNNINTPYYGQMLTVMLSPNPTNAYSGAVSLSCNVTPMVANAPTCTTNPNSSMVAGMATLQISTASATTIGPYTVTVTGQDTNIGGSPTQTSVLVNVGYLSGTLSIGASGNLPVQVPFVGASAVNVSFVCAMITGPQGINDFNAYKIGCQTNPGQAVISTDPNNPTSVTVTITTSATNARLERLTDRIFATFCFGLPAIVLLGSLPFKGFSRKRILQLLGLTLLLAALLESVGCGGNGFTRPSVSTPSGTYSILVQAKDSSGAVQSSAVIPFDVVGGSL